jgi:hypothetical protein
LLFASNDVIDFNLAIVVQAVGEPEVADWFPDVVEYKEQQAVGNIEKLRAKPGCSTLIGNRKLARISKRVLKAPS